MANTKLPKVNVKEEVETPVVESIPEVKLDCPECKGLGLVGNLDVAGQHSVCTRCNGTGRVN